MAQRCYWDLGRWSDLWRAWRPLPQAGLTFEQCLSRAAGLEVGGSSLTALCWLAGRVTEGPTYGCWVFLQCLLA